MRTDTSKPSILTEAVRIAKLKGLFNFSRADVAQAAEVSDATVSYHFGTMRALRQEIVRHAVENEIMSILADARAGREVIGVSMNGELRKKIAHYLVS